METSSVILYKYKYIYFLFVWDMKLILDTFLPVAPPHTADRLQLHLQKTYLVSHLDKV